MTIYKEVRTTEREPEREQRLFTFKATQLIWLSLGILEALIALRIGLKLIGANPDNPFATLLYNFTNIFLFPFVGLTGTPAGRWPSAGNFFCDRHGGVRLGGMGS